MDATAVARATGQPVPVQIAPSSLSLQAVTLAEVFRKPDMEFGGFSVVLDPRCGPQLLVKVDKPLAWRTFPRSLRDRCYPGLEDRPSRGSLGLMCLRVDL